MNRPLRLLTAVTAFGIAAAGIVWILNREAAPVTPPATANPAATERRPAPPEPEPEPKPEPPQPVPPIPPVTPGPVSKSPDPAVPPKNTPESPGYGRRGGREGQDPPPNPDDKPR